MSIPIIIGLDPGSSGGIAWTKPGGGVVACAMPDDFDALALLAYEILAATSSDGPLITPIVPVVVFCEQVSGYVAPAKGSGETCDVCDGAGMYGSVPCSKCNGTGKVERENRQPGHAMFTFGKNTGAAIMAFKMIGATVHEVPAKTWQAPLFLKKGDASKTVWKNKLKATAQRFFPGVKVTLKTADALLILRYGMMREGAGAVVVQGTPQRRQNEARARKEPARKIEGGIVGTYGQCGCHTPFFSSSDRVLWMGPGKAELFLCLECSKGVAMTKESGRLYVGEWKGAAFVFRATTAGNGWVIERKATDADKARMPRKP